MNFFGHAVVATRGRARGPRFVLGAMLPDFATMLRLRVPDTRDPELGAGIAFHHATDEVFHGAAAFHRASSVAMARLSAAGLERGAARAIAHIGVEILIDRALAHDRAARDAYIEAIADEAGFASAAWAQAEDAARALRLRAALVQHGVDIHVCGEAVIAERLFRILERRPRLAFPDAQLPLVTAWVRETDPEIAAITPALVAEVVGGTRPV